MLGQIGCPSIESKNRVIGRFQAVHCPSQTTWRLDGHMHFLNKQASSAACRRRILPVLSLIHVFLRAILVNVTPQAPASLCNRQLNWHRGLLKAKINAIYTFQNCRSLHKKYMQTCSACRVTRHWSCLEVSCLIAATQESWEAISGASIQWQE